MTTNGKTNGNTWVTKWLLGSLWGVLVMVIMFMGNVVRGNDLQNRSEHEKIEEHSVERHEKQEQKIIKIEGMLSSIQVEQMRQGTILERIERKL